MNPHLNSCKRNMFCIIAISLCVIIAPISGCLSVCASVVHRFHAGEVSITSGVYHNRIEPPSSMLCFRICDEKNRTWGMFRLSDNPEQYMYSRDWYNSSYDMDSCDYVKYVSRGGSGKLYVKVHGYGREYVCDITDECWDDMENFVLNWKSRCKFIHEDEITHQRSDRNQ